MRARASAGFTLLEILVAVAVLGLLLAGLTQTVRFGLTAWLQEGRLSAGQTDLEAVDRTLRSLIENLAPGDESARSVIEGGPNSLTGVTQLRVPDSGIAMVPVDAGLGVSGTQLVLRWRPHHHGLPLGSPPPATETGLIGGVSRLGIEYWRPPGVWVSSWRDPDLPLLIRFRLTFAGGKAPRWPDIVAAPRLSRP